MYSRNGRCKNILYNNSFISSVVSPDLRFRAHFTSMSPWLTSCVIFLSFFILMVERSRHFGHVNVASLSWHMQNCSLIRSVFYARIIQVSRYLAYNLINDFETSPCRHIPVVDACIICDVTLINVDKTGTWRCFTMRIISIALPFIADKAPEKPLDKHIPRIVEKLHTIMMFLERISRWQLDI